MYTDFFVPSRSQLRTTKLQNILTISHKISIIYFLLHSDKKRNLIHKDVQYVGLSCLVLYAALFWLELSIAQRVGGGYILHYLRQNIFVIMIRVPNVRLHRLLSRSNRFVQYLEVFKRALPWILESMRNSNNRFAVTNHGRGHGKNFDQLLTYIKQ